MAKTMGKELKGYYEFGQFRMDTARKVLLRDSEPVNLTSKAFETLQVLVERSDRVVSKDELMQALWPDSFVEESNLTQHISVLRKALGETPQDHKYIVTFPGRGYRFTETVRFITQELSDRDETAPSLPPEDTATRKASPRGRSGFPKKWAWVGLTVVSLLASMAVGWWIHTPREARPTVVATDPGHRKMLAVLPFQNLSNDAAQEYFSDGLTEETITDLGELSPEKLGVIARTSAMAYKHTDRTVAQIGRELGADYILEGSVRREGETARVSAQLIRVNDQSHLWAHTYEREVKGMLALQNELGTAIAKQVQIKLEPERAPHLSSKHPLNTESYELYLQGLFFLNKRTHTDENKSAELFEQSTEKDPGFALAYAGLANAYLALSIYSPGDFFPKAASAARRALELDDTLAEAHAALGAEKADFEFDWPGADEEFKRAIELNPNSAVAHFFYSAYYLIPLSKSEQAASEMEKALELDPRSPIFTAYVGLDYFYARQYEKALMQYNKTVALYPDFHITHYWLAWLYSQRQQFPEAIAEITKARLLEGGDRAKWAAANKVALTKAFAAKGPAGFWEEIQRVNEATGRNFGELDIPQVYARLGKKDLAVEWLGRNYEARSPFTTYMNVDPAYDLIRSDPAFEALSRRIGVVH
jgi:TolB-like protein/DNA-binding winged helix-turn-helix (wHTH) protein/Tfp pilus assembly protein PilF